MFPKKTKCNMSRLVTGAVLASIQVTMVSGTSSYGADVPDLPSAPLHFNSFQNSPQWNIHRILPDGTGEQVIVANGQNSMEPAVSWDGSKIAWYGGTVYHADIYVANSDGTDIQVITPDNLDNVVPSFSPDGTMIAYTVVGGQVLRLIPTAGGTPQTVGMGSFPEWSPDGSKILNTDWSSGYVAELYVLDLATGINQRIFASPGYMDLRATWSPDGSKIAFQSNRDGDNDVWIMNSGGTGLENLTVAFDLTDEGEPTWSPDGQFIAFTSSRTGSGDLYIMRSDGAPLSDGSAFFQVTHTPWREFHSEWPKHYPPASPTIPTVSERGMVVLAFLLLAGLTLVFRARRTATA